MGFKSYINELKNLKKLLERFIQERERLENESAIHIGKNFGLADYDLHILIKNVAIEKFEDRYYADAVESAFKEVYTYPRKLDHKLRWILRYNILYHYLKLVEETYVSKTPKS
jgi:hypothetical protein